MYVTAAATAWHLFVSAIRRKKNAKANGYAVQVCWSLKNVEVKNTHLGMVYTVYHLFMVIWGIVFYCEQTKLPQSSAQAFAAACIA